MRMNKRGIAWLLAASMLISTPGFQTPAFGAYAAINPMQDNLIIATGSNAEEPDGQNGGQTESDRIDVILPLQPIVSEEDLSGLAPVVYWNPGEKIQIDLEEGAPMATSSNAAAIAVGTKKAEGFHPSQPLKSLSAAVKQAEKLAEQLEIPEEDVVIYAMNPMEIREGEAFFLDGKGATVKPWNGREESSGEGNDLVFQVKGGQLSLKNVNLQPVDETDSPEDSSLIQVDAGKVQLGEGAVLSGAITLNYETEDEAEETDVETATVSNADQKQDVEDVFINKATPSGGIQLEETENEKTETGKAELADQLPVVELLSDFDGIGPCYLDVRAGEDMEQVELVRTMYADDMSPEAFLEQFRFSDGTDLRWEMEVVQQEGGTLRKEGRSLWRGAATPADAEGTDEIPLEDDVNVQSRLTRKTLVARAGEGDLIYWNPGENVTVNGVSYPAGSDSNGGVAAAPVKTWTSALDKAKGSKNGTIVCVQSLCLDSNGNATEFLGDAVVFDEHSSMGFPCYHIDGKAENPIKLRSAGGSAVFIIEPGTCGEFQDITFVGGTYGADGTQAVETTGGQIVLKGNVETDQSFLQIGLEQTDNTKEIPLEVRSENVKATVFFAGINNNLNKRFLDVVVPGGTEEGSLGQMAETDPDGVGKILLENIKLASANQNPTGNGYQWKLQQDGLLDDEKENPQNLELYTDFYYENIYLDGVRGNDSYLGASCQFPVKTWERATQILEQAVYDSVEARKEATENGDELPPLPKTITICGTVTVTEEENWMLPEYRDYDGKPIPIEVVSHTDIPENEDETLVHALPKILVSVEGETASLTLGNGIFIRNITDEKNSATVSLSDGAALTLTGNAVLSGEKDGNPTIGYHVVANFDAEKAQPLTGNAGCSVSLSADWTGAIESRGIGVYACGENTTVTMDGGTVRKNQSYKGAPEDMQYMDSGKGAGIVCRDGASFTMNDGKIEGNQSVLGGAGVWIGNRSKFMMYGGTIQKNIANSYIMETMGGGILIDGMEADCQIEGTESSKPSIQENSVQFMSDSSGNGFGGGICLNDDTAKLTMKSCLVSKNEVDSPSLGYGAGIAVLKGSAEISDTEITENKATGIAFGGGVGNEDGTVIVDKTIFQGNQAKAGGGVYQRYGETRLTDCQITQNSQSGVSVKNGNLYMKSCQIQKNSSDNYGGGIGFDDSYSSATVIMDACQVLSNHADQNGGGIYIQERGKLYGTNVIIKGNTALKDGGGIYSKGISNDSTAATCVLQDTRIEDNRAEENGGGLFINRTVDFTLKPGSSGSVIHNNKAGKSGGGIYQEGNRITTKLELTGENSNQAGEQGHNVALMGGTLYLLSGNFYYPEDAENKEIYNAYLKRQPGDSQKFYMDPEKVFIESTAQGEEAPNAIYLDSPDCYITYLSDPVVGTSGYKLPITLNKEKFSVGSTAARPAGNDFRVSVEEIPEIQEGTRNAKAAGSRSLSYTYSCTTASDPNGKYHEGSVTPIRTSLGGYTSNGLTDLVLVGQGIYLDGERGDNQNSGLSPAEAVKDFATAEDKLKAAVEAANKDTEGEGFAPFIYICGPVTVSSSETWNLEHDQAPYKNSRYEAFEKTQRREPEAAQVKRFASFVDKPLVTVVQGGTITADTLIVNGMKDAVITAEQRQKSPIFQIEKGTLNLNGNAVVRDNYYNLINMNGGKLNLNGADSPENFHQLEVRSHGYGVYAVDGAQISMTDGASIYVENAEKGDYGVLTSELNQYYSSDSPWIGVILAAGSTMTMADSHIFQQNLEDPDSKQGYGIVMGAMSYNEQSQTLDMSGNSSISNFENGIFLRTFGAQITLRGQSSITNTDTGINTVPKVVAKIKIQLMDEAVIQDAEVGISMSDYGESDFGFDSSDEASTNEILIDNDAGIRDMKQQGIYLHNGALTKVTMSGSSYIMNCEYAGIDVNKYFCTLKIELKGQAKIHHNGHVATGGSGPHDAGLKLNSDKKNLVHLNMQDSSEIFENGGAGVCVIGDPYITSSQAIIVMEDLASIHTNNIKQYSNGGGMVLEGSGELTMRGHSSIEDNFVSGIRDGNEDNSGGTSYIFSSSQVELLDNSRVEGNGKRNNDSDTEINLYYVGSKLRLADQAQVGQDISINNKDSILLYGSLYLEGTARVNGRIYLQNPEKPIIMTKHVPRAQENTYRLHLSEGFVGQNVVIPYPNDNSYPEIEETNPVPEVSSQLPYFEKSLGDGLAGDPERVLRESGVNIILSGENNVYLSGEGDDKNNGLTPATAVRTFKRAKELLEGGEKGGYFTEGANILITEGVLVESGDTDWGFDEGGFVTNETTGDHWKPVVKAYEEFASSGSSNSNRLSHMIGVKKGQVRFHDITIGHSVVEGNKSTLGGVLYVESSSSATATVILEEGAIIEDVQINATSKGEYPMILLANDRSVLNLDGGIIQNCTYKNPGAKEYFFGSLIDAANGHLIIQDGKILNNEVEVNDGSVALINGNNNGYGDYIKFEMSGGIIEKNQIKNKKGDTTGLIIFGGGYKEREVTFSGGIIRENKMLVDSDSYASVLYISRITKASITGGTIQDNQSNTAGAAIYYDGSDGAKLEISGGLISNNQMTAPDGTTAPGTGKNAAVYIDGPNFTLKGGGGIITDAIYLTGTDHPITLSGPIYQYDRSYTVYVNKEGTHPFMPGSVVVRPDTVWLSDATPYLGNFKVMAMPYILDQGQADKEIEAGDSKLLEKQCLILMRAVFVDGEGGSDENSGTDPKNAVKTFEQAKEKGKAPVKGSGTPDNEYYVIYASGPVLVEEEVTWTLPETAYLCRYTGFPVYDEDGNQVSESETRGYVKELVKVKNDASLTLGTEDEGVSIFGRRSIDSNLFNGDSLISIEKGGKLLLHNGLLSRNNNTGVKDDEYYGKLTGTGGAVRVEDGAAFQAEGGTITGMEATKGAAVYVAGTITLDKEPVIRGDVYLAERKDAAFTDKTVIQVTEQYSPGGYAADAEGTKLSVHVEYDHNGRVIIQYPDGVNPTAEQMDYYQLEDYVLAVYDFLQNAQKPNQLMLQRRQVYFLDGIEGNDDHDGKTPDNALKTLDKLYENLSKSTEYAGAVVYVVNGVTITDEVTLTNYIVRQESAEDSVSRIYKGSYQSGDETYPVKSQVTFMRYVRPEGADDVEGFKNAQTCLTPLFQVEEKGNLSLNGIYLDGGVKGTTYLLNEDGTNPLQTAGCSDAQSPLVAVKGETAAITLDQVTDQQIKDAGDNPDQVIRIRTTLRNNQNLKAKTGTEFMLGNLDGKEVYEGSSAGVEILKGASCHLNYTEFSNLSLGGETQSVTGGTDVYTNGQLHIESDVYFTGSVFLEGLGEEQKANSRFLTMDYYLGNIRAPFQLKMRDPYSGRTMIAYPNDVTIIPENSIGYFILEEALNDYFRLGVRETEKNIYELVPPPVVYIDGQAGKDTYGEVDARELGTSPAYAVRTLKKAYELMQNRSVNILYVVDTVEIKNGEAVNLTDTSYFDQTMTAQEPITLQNHLKEVQIRRYVKPVTTDSKFEKPSFEDDVLFRVQDGGSLTFVAENDYEISLDGHMEARTDPRESQTLRTEKGAEAKAPLIQVMEGGNASLSGNIRLYNNKNIAGTVTTSFFDLVKETAEGIDGGALNNQGTVTFAGARFEGNEAVKGAGVYQDGTFTIDVQQPEGLVNQEIYLTTQNTGTEAAPQWGEDHVITSQVWLEDSALLDLNMDHAVAGRDVIVYNGYQNVDEQHSRYKLGQTVPDYLFLAQAPDYDNVLELQDWQVLDVEVPEEIFLAIRKDRKGMSLWNGASASAELTSPEYQIVNHGPYEVKVSLIGVTDESSAVGINQTTYPAMELVEQEDEAVSEKQLYLALEGVNAGGAEEDANGFADLEETPLAKMIPDTDAPSKEAVIMGVLEPNEAGKFQFKAQASEEFLNSYMDPEFPLEGTGDMEEVRKNHYRTIDPDTGEVKAEKARAMFQMNYRLELAQPRRNSFASSDSGQ